MDDQTATPTDSAAGPRPRLAPGTRRILSDLEDYWCGLSRARRIPFRSEVDPGRIDVALPHSFIVQRVARGTGRIRVAGSRVEQVLGLDPRGMPLSAVFTPSGRVALGHWFAEVFDRPAIVELPLVSARGIGRPRLSGAMLLLPLAAEDGTVSMALGAMVTEGEIGRGPRRFDVPDGEIRIHGVEVPKLAAEPPRRAPVAHRMVTQTPPLAVPRPYLRLVVDNG